MTRPSEGPHHLFLLVRFMETVLFLLKLVKVRGPFLFFSFFFFSFLFFPIIPFLGKRYPAVMSSCVVWSLFTVWLATGGTTMSWNQEMTLKKAKKKNNSRRILRLNFVHCVLFICSPYGQSEHFQYQHLVSDYRFCIHIQICVYRDQPDGNKICLPAHQKSH